MKYFETLLIAVATAIVLSLSFGYEAKTQKENGNEIAVARVPGVPITKGTPPCIQMYYFIEKYAEEYEIPLSYAYGVAFVETRYQGPFNWEYNPAQTSSAGAVGPMQIMPSTAELMWPDSSISTAKLRTDIEFNVRTSMKLLRKLYDKYGDWKTVFGCYNTGRPMVNDYAIKVYNFKPEFK